MVAVNLKVINSKTASEEKVSFDDKNIGLDNIAYVVDWQRARRRSGSAKIKQMWEISGTTAKPHNQKGTGKARAGSRRTTQFVGGRTCFGPIPRSFDFSMPKKIAQKAVCDALKVKLSQKEVLLLDGAVIKDGKTSAVNKLLKDNKIDNALIICSGEDKNCQFLVKAVRNIKNVKALDIKAINVYDLLRYKVVIFEQSLLDNVKKIID